MENQLRSETWSTGGRHDFSPLLVSWRRVGLARNVFWGQVIIFLTFWLKRNSFSWGFCSLLYSCLHIQVWGICRLFPHVQTGKEKQRTHLLFLFSGVSRWLGYWPSLYLPKFVSSVMSRFYFIFAVERRKSWTNWVILSEWTGKSKTFCIVTLYTKTLINLIIYSKSLYIVLDFLCIQLWILQIMSFMSSFQSIILYFFSLTFSSLV